MASLSSALSSKHCCNADSTVIKTATIQKIQLTLTHKILKKFNECQHFVEVTRKLNSVEGISPISKIKEMK